ncbi:transcription termination factor NusA [Spiroplasma endosymbiont of Labia minor]|uniref:transcription termination factor NusA n=1 Tax=Spiroplasma endosymbiont of Labia minor TaxID=3066305 RepID=UPI0030CB061F
MVNGAELLSAIYTIVEEKKIDKEIILEGIREGFQKAYERYFDPEALVDVEIDEKLGTIKVFKNLTVVQKIQDEYLEIGLNEAKKTYGENVTIGDTLKQEVDFDEQYSRLAVIQVGNIIKQKIREAEKAKIFDEFQNKVGEILVGTVVDITDTAYLLETDGAIASLWFKRVIDSERFNIGEKIEYYVIELSKDNKFAQISASRTDPQFLVRQFERQVPEVQNGEVIIKKVSRDPGKRAKVAVLSLDPYLDPVGAMIGSQGNRVKAVSEKVHGEKIDLVRWDENMGTFLQNAMSPVFVCSFEFNEEYTVANVVVPDSQFSLAIGKFGSAAKLVANLLDIKLNVTSLSNAIANNQEVHWNGNISKENATDQDYLDSMRNKKTTVMPNININFDEPLVSRKYQSKPVKKPMYKEQFDDAVDTADFEGTLDLEDIEANRAAFDAFAAADDETIDAADYDDYDDLYDN